MKRAALLTGLCAIGVQAAAATATPPPHPGRNVTFIAQQLPFDGTFFPGVVGPGGIEADKPGDPAASHTGEPQIAVSRSGRVYVTSYGGRQWRSDDGGASFTVLPPLTVVPRDFKQMGDADTAVTVDQAGREVVHAVSHGDGQGNALFYRRSTDHPAGRESYDQALPTGGPADRPYLSTGRDGTVYLIWVDYYQHGRRQLYFRKSTDHGATFTAPVLPLLGSDLAQHTGQATCFNRFERVLASPSALHIPYIVGRGDACTERLTERTPPMDEMWLATSTDGGATWNHRLVADRDREIAFIFPAGAISADGTLLLAWSERSEGDGSQVVVQASRDDGATWLDHPVTLLAAGAHAALMPSIVGAEKGRADVVWYSGSRCADGSGVECWTVAAAGLDGLDGHGPVRVAYGTVTDDIVRRGPVCTLGLGCSLGRAQPIDAPLREFLDATRDSQGRLHVVWTDAHQVTMPNGKPAPVAVWHAVSD